MSKPTIVISFNLLNIASAIAGTVILSTIEDTEAVKNGPKDVYIWAICTIVVSWIFSITLIFAADEDHEPNLLEFLVTMFSLAISIWGIKIYFEATNSVFDYYNTDHSLSQLWMFLTVHAYADLVILCLLAFWVVLMCCCSTSSMDNQINV